MAKSVFVTRRTEIMRTKHINDLVRHLHDPERWPMDREAYCATLSGNSMVLVTAVLESYGRGDPEFRRYAQALTLVS